MPVTTINIRSLSIDREGLTLFIGPLEAAIMRAIWSGESTSRGVFTHVRENYTPDRSDELAFTTITSTLDRLTHRGFLTRIGDRQGYVYTPAQATEDEFVTQCVAHVLGALMEWYPIEVAKTIKQYIATRGINTNGK